MEPADESETDETVSHKHPPENSYILSAPTRPVNKAEFVRYAVNALQF